MKQFRQVTCRKIAKTTLAFILLLSLLLPSFSHAISMPTDDRGHDSSLPFTDVEPTDWFYEQVRHVFGQGLMTGTGNMTFSPGVRVTRAMAVQVLYNHSGNPGTAWIENPFADVAEDAWYRDAVVWAASWGIVRGFGDGRFAPGEYITRAHLVLILNNYTSVANLTLPLRREAQPFVDSIDIRDYAKEAIDRFFRGMVIDGRPDGTFDPQGHATRAELATILSRFVRYSENADVAPPVPPYGFLPPPPAPEYGFPYMD